jgi:hypothetical protein
MYSLVRNRVFGGLIAAVVLLVAPVQLRGQDRPQDKPWIGAWRLDPAASTAPADGAPYGRVEVEIAPRPGDALEVVYDMVGTRGGRTRLEWRGRMDGQDYTVQGLDYVLTNAYSPAGDGYRIVVKRDGQVVATTRVEVSPDGRTLTAVTSPTVPEGQGLETTSLYRRIE